MIWVAPTSRAAWMALSPTPPQPITATVCPARTSARCRTAPTPVSTAQPSSAADSSGISSGIRTSPRSDTSMWSAKPPRPMKACTSAPARTSRGPPPVLVWPLSVQCWVSPRRQ